MKTEVKKIDSTKREISVEISGEQIKAKFSEVYKNISEEAKVPGFRPGHVPQEILEKNFSAHAREQVIKDLIPEAYNKALEKEALDAIDLPEIFDVKLDVALLSFKAKLEVSPEINLKDYKGLKINYKKITVGLDEIKRYIDSLKESRKIDLVDDGFAKSLGFLCLADLEKSIEMQIFIQKQNQQRSKMEKELIDGLVGNLDFKVPQGLINRQLEEMLRQTKLDMALKGVPREKIDEQDKALRESMQETAKKEVKVYLVFSEIARKENIPQGESMPARVVELLFKAAKWTEAA